MTVLEIDGAGRVFGSGRLRVVALDDVSLRVSAGEFVAVMRAQRFGQVDPAAAGGRAGPADLRPGPAGRP